MEATEHWQTILDGATRSPSPHNTQPWRVRLLNATEAELYLDSNRLIPDEDPTGFFQVSAAGIFIEAIDLLASHLGLRLKVDTREIRMDRPLVPVAHLKLTDDLDVVRSAYSAASLASRRTSRLAHNGQRLAPDAAAQLGDIASGFGQCFGHSTDRALIERVLARNTSAVFEDLNNPPYHDEFIGWLRTKPKAEAKRDGLSLKCMQMSGLEYHLLRLTPWVLRVPGLNRLLGLRYRQVVGQTDHIGWFSGPFWGNAQAIQAGRFMLRFWLALDALGMGMHPFGNLITNASAQRWVKNELPQSDQAWIVFRFGQTAPAGLLHNVGAGQIPPNRIRSNSMYSFDHARQAVFSRLA